MNKKDLVAKLKQLEGLTPEERAELINLLNTKKKYGLVWEDKPEDVEEQLRTQLPVLREVVEKRILATPQVKSLNQDDKGLKDKQDKSLTLKFDVVPDSSKSESLESFNLSNHSSDDVASPNHILIEGDNLHALTALTFTHEGKIDLMYFDPPYNTGNKDFKYNDTYVDKEDSYRHSKWLSFMHKRLEIAKRLLSDKGVIFISIDINELAQLKLLCDDIFLNERFVNLVANINNPKGRSDEKNIATAHEYLLCYSMGNIDFGGWKAGDNILKRYNKVDKNGLIYREIDLRKTGDNDRREDRPNLFYYFLFNPSTRDFYPTTEENIPVGYIQIKPTKADLTEGNWRWALETSKANIDMLFPKLMGVRKKYTVFEKDLLVEEDKIKATTVWNQKEVNSERGSEQFIDLGFDKKQFPKPKPLGLLKLIFELMPTKNPLILDIFAGSGTTLHATMQLNAEDGGNRQCILVTNNENNICEEVTYERNKRVIQGYTNTKGVPVAGLANNNLRYYRSEYVGREKTHKNKRELVLAATELLCIKEDIYTELAELNGHKLDKKTIRCFSDKGRYLMVIYDEETIETLLPLISAIDTHHKIKIYIFAPGQYPFTEEFEDVLDKVELCALPDAIYKAYSNVLPKKKAKSVENSDEESTETGENKEPNLFTE